MRATFVLACASLIVAARPLTIAQAQRLEYRAVFASARQLARQLDEAGRDGYACEASVMEILGGHISRNHGFAPASARIRRDDRGTFVLTTVVTQRGR